MSASISSLSRSGPMILTELSPLMPERASITLSRMFCEKFQVDARELCVQLGVHRVDDLVLGAGPHRAEDPSSASRSSSTSLRPVLLRPQRDEVFAVVVAVGVGGVVGPAELVDDRLDLGIGGHDGPCLPGDLGVSLERRVERSGAANPHVALFQRGHEFAAQEGQHHDRADGQRRHHADGHPTVFEANPQVSQVARLHPADEPVVGRRLQILEQQQAQHRRHGQRQQQGAAQGEGVRVGHRSEDLPFGPLHGEQRQKGADHDGRREEQSPLDLVRGLENPLLQRQLGIFARAEVAIDVLDHDHRRIDDDAEIDRADRQQIGRLAPHDTARRTRRTGPAEC